MSIQKSGMIILGAAILIVLVACCLGSTGQKPNMTNASVQPSPSLFPMQTVTDTPKPPSASDHGIPLSRIPVSTKGGKKD
jgi:uncharacterized lipoprotein